MQEVSKTCAFPPELIEFAESEVRAGRYGSVDEVLQTALRRLQQHDILIDDGDAPELLAALEQARDDIRHGRYAEGSPRELMDGIRKEVGL